jgi:fructose-bisphosphate aldolase class II
MQKPSLKELLDQAKLGHYAIGAFNIFDYISAKAAIDAANELCTPILLQTSVGTVKQFGPSELFDMLNILRKKSTVPILFHLDHCTDPGLAKLCIDSGWDSVMIDMSAKSIEENIGITSDIKAYANKSGVCVEGELGIITGVEEEISANHEILASYEDSIRFINATKVDAFAPAIGTAHGLYKREVNLNYDLVKKLGDINLTPVVVHGGTGLSDEQFAKLIACGASKINVSTVLKHAFIDGIKHYLDAHPEEYNPLTLTRAAEASVKKVVEEHIRRFGSK